MRMQNSEQNNRAPLHVRETLHIYLRAILRYRYDAVISQLLPVSSVLLGVVMPYFASKVLAELLTRNGHLWTHFYWFVGSAIAGILLNGWSIRHSVALQAKVMDDLQQKMYGRLLGRSVGFYNNQIGGKLVSDAIDFVSSFGSLYNTVAISALPFLATVVIGVAVVFLSSWVLGAILTALLLILTFWTMHDNRQRSQLRSNRLKVSKQLIGHLSDTIVNAVTVKTFAREADEKAVNAEINTRLKAIRIKDWQRGSTGETERLGMLLLIQAVLLFVVVKMATGNPQLLASGIFAFSYTMSLISRFFTISTLTRQIEESFLQASPMTELLQQDTEIMDIPGAEPLAVRQGEIICKDVEFSYADSTSEETVFKNLNLHIKPGERIGLVGHSGGGKSTLTRLLLRFEDITGGSITIDGQDIRDVTQTSLREAVAYVPQEPLLFHRSIKDNIAYGKPDSDDEAIRAAAKLAYADDFIGQLAERYDTIIGERGVKLSGGQRQRIAIARAILKNAPILVLDEATSALDSESEKMIQSALWELMKNKTSIVIAHRLSTIQRLDRIIVLDNGSIIEEGTHQQLLKQDGLYARLWKHQSGGFMED